MIRVIVTPEQRDTVQALRRDPMLRPAERDRVEMVLLSAEGWSPPRVARHLGCRPVGRSAALRGRRPERPPDPQVSEVDRRSLAADGDHAQAQAGPRPCGAGGPRTDQLEKKSAAGQLRLAFLDECGFSPSQPNTLSWVRCRARMRVPYENPQGRRLNVLAATVHVSDTDELHWLPARRHFDAVYLVCCLEQLADGALPTVVALDNAGFHRARLVRDALPRLRELGAYLYYLPPYSPELNDIERLFRVIKHHDLPERTYATFDALHDAVHQAFSRYEDAHCLKPAHHPARAP